MIIACSFEEDKLCSTVCLVIQRGSSPVAGPGSVQLCLDEVAVLGRPRVYALSTSLFARDHVLPTIDPRYLCSHYAHLSIHVFVCIGHSSLFTFAHFIRTLFTSLLAFAHFCLLFRDFVQISG